MFLTAGETEYENVAALPEEDAASQELFQSASASTSATATPPSPSILANYDPVLTVAAVAVNKPTTTMKTPESHRYSYKSKFNHTPVLIILTK